MKLIKLVERKASSFTKPRLETDTALHILEPSQSELADLLVMAEMDGIDTVIVYR